MNGLVRMGLGMSGVPDQTIDEIDRQTPALQRLSMAFQELEKILGPDINRAIPVLKKAYPDLMAVLPVANALLKFFNEKSSAH